MQLRSLEDQFGTFLEGQTRDTPRKFTRATGFGTIYDLSSSESIFFAYLIPTFGLFSILGIFLDYTIWHFDCRPLPLRFVFRVAAIVSFITSAFITFVAYVAVNNQGFLVGVELNPGPVSISYFDILLFVVWCGVREIPPSNTTFALHFWTFAFVGISHLLVASGASSRTSIILASGVASLYTLAISFVLWWLANNQGYLVGVETNPGPRHNHRSPASRTKGKRLNKYLQRQLERNAALRDRSRNADHKYTLDELLFESQAFGVAHGVDADTRNFFVEMAKLFRKTVKDGINVNIDLGIKATFAEWWSYLLEKLEEIKAAGCELLWAFTRFVLRVLLSYCSEETKSMVMLFIGDKIGIEDWGEPETVFESQGGPLMTASCISLAAAIYSKTFGRVWEQGDPLGYLSILANMNKSSKMFASIGECILALIKELINAINHWFQWKLPMPSIGGSTARLFESYYQLRKELAESKEKASVARKIYILRDAAEFSYRESVDKLERENIQWLMRLIDPLAKACEREYNPTNSMRVPPSAILIGGSTGVGKSTFTLPIIMAIVMQIVDEKQRAALRGDHADFIFYRNTENVYMDGLKRSHEVIVYDDFGQLRDVPGGSNVDAFEFIRMKNCAPLHLHMSAVEDKQKHYANPTMLFATTNRARLDFQSIHCPEAVVRRFDVGVLQVPKLEFCRDDGLDPRDPWTRRFDLEKLRDVYPVVPDDVETFVITDAVEFIEWDYGKGRPARRGRVWGFHDFVQHCVSVHQRIRADGEGQIKFVNYIKAKYDPGPSHQLQKQGSSFSAPSGLVEEFLDAEEVCISDDESWDERWEKFKQLVEKQTEPNHRFRAVTTIFAAIATTATLMWGCSKLLRFFNPPSSQSYVSGRNSKITRKDRIRSARTNVRALLSDADLEAQSNVHSDEMFKQLYKVLGRNLYRFVLVGCKKGTDQEVRVEVGMALFVKANLALWPEHFDGLYADFAEEHEDVSILFVSLHGVVMHAVKFTDTEVCSVGDCDLVLNMVPGIRDHANITSYFANTTEKEGDKIPCHMPVFRGDRVLTLLPTQVRIGESREYDDGYKSRLLNYAAPTIKGDCGSPLFTFDKRFGGTLKIMGFHTAGARIGFQTICLGVKPRYDLLESAIETFDLPLTVEQEDTEFAPQGAIDGFVVIGKVQPPVLPQKSRIVPSALSGSLWKPETKPCWLKPFHHNGVRIDPRVLAKIKYNKEPAPVPQALLDTSARILDKRILRSVVEAPWLPRVFTFVEAVGGISGVEFCGGLDRSTSPGYPHNIQSNGKKKWLGSDPEINFSSPGALELRGLVEDVLIKAKQGIRCDHIFLDCLKDERKPCDKVDIGKTRQFMAGPMVLTILMKMYFGDFVRHMRVNRIQNFMTVGISYTQGEWRTLAMHLRRTKDHTCSAGDMKAFDASIVMPVQWLFLMCAEKFYAPTATQEDSLVRRVLFMEVMNSKHIDWAGNVYEYTGKTPSGIFLTADINSYICAIMLISVWLKNGIAEEIIDSDFALATFGDDHASGFPLKYADRAGALAVAQSFWDLYRIEYTDESKGEMITNVKAITDITFLKRSFRLVGDHVLAPLELTVLKETLNWEKTTSDPGTMYQRIDCWFVELARHGRQVFLSMAPRLAEASLLCYDYTSPYSTYDAAITSDVVFGADE